MQMCVSVSLQVSVVLVGMKCLGRNNVRPIC
jgi:hypothetical protein